MNYIALLQQHQLKVTPQRLEIVDIVVTQGHITIDNLYKKLQMKFPTLSLATIYKNINKMCESLFLSEVKIPNQKNVYELTKAEHMHIVCTKCDTIMDLKLNTDELVSKAQDATNYIITNSSIVFDGLCPSCSNTK